MIFNTQAYTELSYMIIRSEKKFDDSADNQNINHIISSYLLQYFYINLLIFRRSVNERLRDV